MAGYQETALAEILNHKSTNWALYIFISIGF